MPEKNEAGRWKFHHGCVRRLEPGNQPSPVGSRAPRRSTAGCSCPLCHQLLNAYHGGSFPSRRFSCMLDLGLSFLASVARDPNALAIADGETRLTYSQWYRRISALVAGFDAIGLQTGDHLVTALQHRWEK